jgi:hypothetical protein
MALIALLASGAATPFDDLIKPERASSACFARVYDAGHLRAHPGQKTTAIKVWLRYETTIGGAAPDVVLSAAVGITQRGDAEALYSDGDCNWDERANRDTSNNRLIKAYPREAGMVCLQSAQPNVFASVSAQEGGVVIMNRGNNRDTLMLYLDDSLIMVKRANRRNLLDIRFGPDDRVFMLRRTDLSDCATVRDAVTTPEPGVRRRQR